jgi:hypothetical protein
MSAIHFAFLINGKEINPASAESPEQQDMMERVMETISARMEGVTCPDHNEAPRFLCSGESIDDLSIQIHGCCEKLVDMAERRMTE